jgi:His/Glu/Gln/Arg/opine family amino acid ABC transporter permease subunit
MTASSTIWGASVNIPEMMVVLLVTFLAIVAGLCSCCTGSSARCAFRATRGDGTARRPACPAAVGFFVARLVQRSCRGAARRVPCRSVRGCAGRHAGQAGRHRDAVEVDAAPRQGLFLERLISAVAVAIGTALGFLMGIALVSPRRWVRSPSWLVTQILRNAPWLVLLFFCMFLLPFRVTVFGTTIPVPGLDEGGVRVRAADHGVRRGDRARRDPIHSRSAVGIGGVARLLANADPVEHHRPAVPQADGAGWMNLVAIVAMASTLASMVGVPEVMTVSREKS